MIVLFMMSVLVVCWTIIDCLLKKNNSEDHVSKQRTTITGHLTGVFLVLEVVPYPSKYFLILMIHSKVIIVNT